MSVTPYYQDELVAIYHGDCRDVLAELEYQPNVIVTDPPYSSGGFQESGRAGGSIGTTRERGDLPTLRMDNLSTRGYRRLMRSVIDLSRCSELYMFTDWRMWIESFDAAEEVGLRVRSMIVWDKLQPGMGSPWRNQHELILYACRESPKSKWGLGTVRSHKRSGNQFHPTEKPVPLLHDLLQMVSREYVVIDPFVGGGSTLTAAKLSGHRGIGIEIEERHCETSAKRCAQQAIAPDPEPDPEQQELLGPSEGEGLGL